jgi:hypothetical protein
MKKFAAVFALTTLGSLSAFAGEFTGYISDTQCAAMNKNKKAATEWINPKEFESCVKKCVKSGSAAVFLTPDNKIIKIDAASMDKVTPMLGHKVAVTGKIDGDVLTIDSISDAK